MQMARRVTVVVRRDGTVIIIIEPLRGVPEARRSNRRQEEANPPL